MRRRASRNLPRIEPSEVPFAVAAAMAIGSSFDRGGFPERIKSIVDLYGRQSDAAAAIGVRAATIRSWIVGVNLPSFELVATLALGKGVNLHWLATGQGKMHLKGRASAAEILTAFADLDHNQRLALVRACEDIDAAKARLTDLAGKYS